jgi:hypothetical protein
MPNEPTLRREYDPVSLLSAHPPKLRHPHKRLVFELACPPSTRQVSPSPRPVAAAACISGAISIASS